MKQATYEKIYSFVVGLNAAAASCTLSAILGTVIANLLMSLPVVTSNNLAVTLLVSFLLSDGEKPILIGLIHKVKATKSQLNES